MSASNPIWVTDPTVLSNRLASRPQHVGLDTEFIRERTFWPQLALVQLAIDDDILLLDPLAPGILDALRPLLLDQSIVKIMHSAGEDLVAFSHSCNAAPTPLFDTQVAAALTGIAAGIGYQRLVADLLGVELAKGQTRSDWLKRPLSDAQLEYAADDVRYLGGLYDQLSARLDALGRRDWFEDDCARQVSAAGSEPEPWPHLSARGAQHVDGPSRIRLLRLLRWREARARSHDRPRNWVLDNELAFELARRPPENQDQLQRRLDAHPKAPRKLAAQIWSALETPLADEAEAPEPPAVEADRKTVRQMQEAVSALGASLGIPDGVLASRKRLEQLLETGRWPDALSGWRREQLEPVLAPLMAEQLPSADPAV
ncbi:ribonuclease D [Luteimonas sp. A478]